jgi:hypothetical protein
MKYLLLFVLPFSLLGGTYMVPSSPVEKVTIKSEIGGKVTLAVSDKEQQFIANTVIVKIDNALELSQIKYYQKQIDILSEIVSLKKENATNKAKVTRLSKYNKNVEKINYLESSKELAALKLYIAQVKLDKGKKIFRVKDRYLQRLHVKKNERIQAGDNIMTLYNTNTIKLVTFMPKEEIEILQKKHKNILFNNKKGDFKLYSIDKLTDETHLSSYRVEFRKDLKSKTNYLFGELVTIKVTE